MSVLSILLLLIGTPAHAQADVSTSSSTPNSDEAATGPTPDPVVIWQPVTTMDEGDFRALDIDGRLQGPGVRLVDEPPSAGGFDFIDLRTDFDSELRQSVDTVR